jgi:hypothetical protein
MTVQINFGPGWWQFVYQKIAVNNPPTPIEGTWKLAGQAGALSVGPASNDLSWFSSNLGDVTTRACLFDDSIKFAPGGIMTHYMDGSTWLEGWQGAPAEGCGTPVAPHTGGAATYTFDAALGTLTVNGLGAHMGLAKVHNAGELTSPAGAVSSIIYNVAFSNGGNTMTVQINFGPGWWQFVYQKIAVNNPPPASPLQPAGLVANSPTTSSIFVACGPNQVGLNNILYRLFYSPTASAPMNPQTASEYTFGTTAGDGNGVGPFGFNVTGLQAATNYTFWLYQYNTVDQLFSTPASVSETTLGGGTAVPITFTVDMNQSTMPAGSIPEVNGTFNNWCGSCASMTDANSDGIWEIIISLAAGSYEYKFSYSNWTGQESLVPGSSCTITTGANTNRSLTVGSAAMVLPTVCYGSCTACSTGPFLTQMNLPVTFEGNTVDYGVIGFEGAEASTIVTDPTNSSNTVVKVIKSASAQPWAGTTITAAAALGLASPVPFSSTNTSMSLKVWSPDAGIQVRLKVENHSNVNQSVETEATTTVANGWQTLVFNFANQASGTAALNLAYSLDKASVFMNFSVPGSSVGEKTYYFDDLMMYVPSTGPTSSILSGSSAICAGDSTNLSVQIVGGTSPYTVVITDGTNNYTSSGTSPVLFTVSPTLTTTTYSIVSVSGGGVGTGNSGTATVSVTPNSINSLTISADNSYTWSNTGQTYTTSGTYTGTTANCVTEQLILTITGAGLEDLSDMGISVQPNPSNGLFSIMNSEQVNLTGSITDCSGRVIYSANFSDLENTIDISIAAQGIYYLKLSSLNYSKVVQIFKN